jgi:hypothetical protein
VIVLGGVGWYLDWYKLSTKPDGDGHQKILLDVNTSKAGSDLGKAGKRVEEAIDKEKSTAPKTDDKGASINVNKQGVEVQAGKIDLALPLKK